MTPLEATEKAHTICQGFEECIGFPDLVEKLQQNRTLVCYDGFEPSGKLHLAATFPKILHFNKLTKLGIQCKILLADVFAQNNDKLGGDVDKIKASAEQIKNSLQQFGLDPSVQFIIASEEIAKRPTEYWDLVMQISRLVTQNRIKKCGKIMGRDEFDSLKASQFLYPMMQLADIYFYNIDICQLGLDQRKVNVLARELSNKLGKDNPVILSHTMLPGLKQGQEKMSKSDPNSAIFMDDTKEVIEIKISKAYCPPNSIDDNPIMQYIKHIVFPWFSQIKTEIISTGYEEERFMTYTNFDTFASVYMRELITPRMIKDCLCQSLLNILKINLN